MNTILRAAKHLCVLACVALLLALSGCMREPETALRIGTNVWIGSEPLYLARELGHLNPAACNSSSIRRRAKSFALFATRPSTAW